MTIRADEWLDVYIPAELMEEFEACDDGGYGSVCGYIHELKPNQTADYITANPLSGLAKYFVDESGIDITDREELVRHITKINDRMGEQI